LGEVYKVNANTILYTHRSGYLHYQRHKKKSAEQLFPFIEHRLVTIVNIGSHLSEELIDEAFGPAVVKVPRFRRMTNVGTVHDQRQRFRLVDAVDMMYVKLSQVTHSWTWIGSIHGLDWIRLGGMTVTPFFKISNHCSTVDDVSLKLCCMNF